MLHGDPGLDRELRGEINKSRRWRRSVLTLLAAIVLAFAGLVLLNAAVESLGPAAVVPVPSGLPPHAGA